MNDEEILNRIKALVEEEEDLRGRHEESRLSTEDLRRVEQIEVALEAGPDFFHANTAGGRMVDQRGGQAARQRARTYSTGLAPRFFPKRTGGSSISNTIGARSVSSLSAP
jgi:hypothetical protein